MRINWQYGDSSTLAKYEGKPVINNGLVYISAGNKDYPTLYCINAQTGIEQWHYTFPNKSFYFTSPQIFNDNIYVLNSGGKLFSLNALTGNLNWEVEVENTVSSSLRGSSSPFSSFPIPIKSSPIIIDNVIYVGSNNGCLYLFEPNTGELLGKIEISEQGVINTPVYLNEYNIICLEISDGSVCVIDLDTQKVKWMYSNPENHFEELEEQLQNYKGLLPDTLFPEKEQLIDVMSSGGKYISNLNGYPVVSKGIVYSGGNRTNFIALDLESGTKIWEFCPSAESKGSGFTSAVVSNNIVCFGNQRNGTLWAANCDNGQILWSYETSTAVKDFSFGSIFSPVISNNQVIIGGRGGYLRGLELQTGQQLWKFEAPHSEIFPTQIMDLISSAVNTIAKATIDNCPFSEFHSPLATDNSIYVVAENGSFKTFLSLSI